MSAEPSPPYAQSSAMIASSAPAALNLPVLTDALAATDAAVLVVDVAGRVLAANAAASALTGYSPEELAALPPGGLDADVDEGITHRGQALHHIRNTGTTHMLHKDGAVLRVVFEAAPTLVSQRRALFEVCWPTV
jgi:PAS domain S-box-containing protein